MFKALQATDLAVLKSSLLRDMIAQFPLLDSMLVAIKARFNYDQARIDGTLRVMTAWRYNTPRSLGILVPVQGVDEAYDSVVDQLNNVSCELEEYLKGQRKALK